VNCSLLIVEDDPDQLEALVRWFIRAGYEVTGVDHPNKALEAASFRRFQVALLDATLPELDGFMLMQRLQQPQDWMQFIILSGQDNLERRANAEGVFACLAKPFKLALLQATVESALERANERLTDREQLAGR
jgi:DNA-binding NtrC family response regulator